MTELLKQAIDLSEKELPIPVSDELVKDWIDSLIDLKEQMIKLTETSILKLNMGELDEKRGEYTHELNTCEFNSYTFRNIQLWHSIEEVARVLNVTPEIRDIKYSDGTESKEASFEYRGYTILELL